MVGVFPKTAFTTKKQSAGEYVFRLYVRDGFQGTERLLIDPEKFVTNASQHMALDWWEPSRDGRFVASASRPRAPSKW